MSRWIDIGPVSDFPPNEHACVTAAGKAVVVFNVEGRFHVIRNVCPHAGLPLGEGERRGHVITCPFHGYAYNIRNGRNIDCPLDEPPVRAYAVRVRHQSVQIEMESDAMTDSPAPQPKRGPAPADKPVDETPPAGNAGSAGHAADDDQPQRPTGYEDPETAAPQHPDKPADSAPTPKPSEEGH